MHMMYFSVYFNDPGYLCKLCERCLQGYSPSRYGHAQPQGDLLDVSIIFFFFISLYKILLKGICLIFMKEMFPFLGLRSDCGKPRTKDETETDDTRTCDPGCLVI